MGQINSSQDQDPNSKGSSITSEHENVTSDSPNSDSKDVDENRVNINHIHCVKSRIDMLIEDCLNIKDSSNDSSDRNQKGGEDGEGKRDDIDKMSDRSKTPDKDENRETNADVKQEIKDSSEHSCSKSDSNSAGGLVNSDQSKENISEDSNRKNNETVEQLKAQPMNRTTFQTFIDKVLDSSLKEDGGPISDCTTNILELCNRSLSSDDSSSTKSNISEKQTNEAKKESVQSKDDPNDSKQSKKIQSDRKITLKDHIERFLELSFKDNDNKMDKKSDSETKKNIQNGKSGDHKGFNAQELMNIQINKLLTPPANASKEPQLFINNKPHMDIETDAQTKEWLKKMTKAGDHSRNFKSKQTEKHQPSYEANHLGEHAAYGHSPNTGHRYMRQNSNSAPSPQVSPKSAYMMGRQSLSDPRDMNHIREVYSRIPNGKDSQDMRFVDPKYGDNRYEHMYRDAVMEMDKREMQMEYAQVAQKQAQGPYYPQRPEARGIHPRASPEQGVPPQMLYPAQYPPRSVAGGGSYPPSGYPGKGMPSPGQVYEQSGQSGRGLVGISHVRLPHPDSHDQRSIDHHKQPRSPNMPRHLVGSEMPHGRMQMIPSSEHPASAMRTPHGALPPGMNYHNMPKHPSHHPSVSAHKEYTGMVMSSAYPGKGGTHQGRRGSVPENKSPYLYSPRGEDHDHLDHMERYSRSPNIPAMHNKTSERNDLTGRPSSVPSQEYGSRITQEGHLARGTQGHAPHNPEMQGRRNSVSKHSETSNDAPLDLSVKMPKSDSQSSKSANYGSTFQGSAQPRKLNPSNTFIKHLEHSVDKYCQELISPTGSPPIGKSQRLPGRPESDMASPPGFPNPTSAQSQGPYSFPARSLPSPQFSGGITMGQPLVNNKMQAMAQQQQQHQQRQSMDYQYGDSHSQNMSNMQQTPPPVGSLPTTQANFDPKRNISNISKHEPIQSIIGNHDPNDILYLICTLCTQTYGSPYGFRKHFRNQHGFEPRAEHTIVQTISATKTALQMPGQERMGHGQPPGGLENVPGNRSPSVPNAESGEVRPGMVRPVGYDSERKSKSCSPTNNRVKSNGSADSDGNGSQKSKNSQKDETGTETKWLECPECGKTFQLNDFGSYKRHCRQHGHLKTSGPYTCSSCQLSFPDQKLLKEHGVVHSAESQGQNDGGEKREESEARTLPGQSSNTCTTCDKQFDDTELYKSHMIAHDQPPTLSPQGQLIGNKEKIVRSNVSASDNKSSASDTNKAVDKKWPDIDFSVIPSKNIVKQAAESMTLLACPDSSWDNTDKDNQATTSDDKCDDVVTEIADSGYSSSVGSNSTVSGDDKCCEKSPAEDKTKQKSVDSNSEVNEDKNCDEDMEVHYKHKKFFHFRKRENSFSSNSNDAPVTKQAKLSPSSSSSSLTNLETSTPVSSSVTTTDPCDSSVRTDSKEKGQKSPKSTVTDTKSVRSPKEQQKVIGSSVKPEARHNLPFVWDRTTRSQRQANK